MNLGGGKMVLVVLLALILRPQEAAGPRPAGRPGHRRGQARVEGVSSAKCVRHPSHRA